MNRPWQTWLLFGLCSAVVLAAMGWISITALRLDRADQDATRRGEIEEKVRLALWRMDSALAPLIAQESARPYFAYTAFHPTELAYTHLWEEIQRGGVMVPSPLLDHASPYIRLHFQVGPDGTFTSPQVPEGNMRDLAESRRLTTRDRIETCSQRLAMLQTLVSRDTLLAAMDPPEPPEAPPPVQVAVRPQSQPSQQEEMTQGFAPYTPQEQGQRPAQTLAQTDVAPQPPPQQAAQPPAQQTVRPPAQQVIQPPAQQAAQPPAQQVAEDQQGQKYDLQRRSQRQVQQIGVYQGKGAPQVVDQQVVLNDNEWRARAYNYEANSLVVANLGSNLAVAGAHVHEELARPVWIGGELILSRWVSANGDHYIQGCWFNWPALHTWLIHEVEDLLPNGELDPVRGNDEADKGRMLAGLPVVRLVPGDVPIDGPRPASPIRISLAIAWGCVLTAALAVAVLLVGTVSLSERRAAFVSAVTHEMRTPLTTFRMYTEMLSKGMIPDEDKRRRYLDTLRSEADRLSHLVANVLAYARLERHRAADRTETVPLRSLVDRVQSRLGDRAERAGMTLAVEAADANGSIRVRADAAAVEQILFNLVDNACKYAATASDRRIHLEVDGSSDAAVLRVRDHGPGISSPEARRLFRPFSKSARQAANSAPGVGLGLALSRRLARHMGGQLSLDKQTREGACFVLTLPTA